jgi:hypothetical protein
MKEYLIKLYEKYPDKFKLVENILKEIENLNLEDQEFIKEKIKILQQYDINNNDKIISNLHRLEINILTIFLISKKTILYDKNKLDNIDKLNIK